MKRAADATEVVVVGGGAMGCAIAWALARRGARVRVLERFSHVHSMGSHGGHTRVIRHAYHEGRDYVPLIDEADRSWDALARRAGDELLVRCGLLEFGPPGDEEYRAAVDSLEHWGVPHHEYNATEAMARWPVVMPQGWGACLSPESGYLRVKACMDALRKEAREAGAVFEYGVRVREIVTGGRDLRVLVDAGDVIACDRVVVCAGAYGASLLPHLTRVGTRGSLVAWRRVLVWTCPPEEAQPALAQMPVWAAMTPSGFMYGFPFHDEGIEGFKLACHTTDSVPGLNDAVDPEKVSRALHEADLAPLEDFLRAHIPSALGPIVAHKACMYGQTADGDFLIDLDPRDARVCLALGFSGHGFKFAPAIGELVGDLLEKGESKRQRERFRLQTGPR
jgi:monomeric sarcosine oxidase